MIPVNEVCDIAISRSLWPANYKSAHGKKVVSFWIQVLSPQETLQQAR